MVLQNRVPHLIKRTIGLAGVKADAGAKGRSISLCDILEGDARELLSILFNWAGFQGNVRQTQVAGYWP